MPLSPLANGSMLLSVSCPPDRVACLESHLGPILGDHPLQPLTRTLTDVLLHRLSSRLSPPDTGGKDFRAPLLAKRSGRRVGDGLGECPVRVRFHDDSHQMTQRTDLITCDRRDRLSSFGDETESSTRLPSGLLWVKLTYNRVLRVENLPRCSPRINRANQTRTPDQLQFDSFAFQPRSG